MSFKQVAARQVAAVRFLVVAALGGATLTACSTVSPAPMHLNVASNHEAYRSSPSPFLGAAPANQSPKNWNGQRYKVGAPYQAGGVWYVPAEQRSYDEVGLASWYGDAFNGKPTANGELFDMNGVSAAHATLPLPSIVEVSNLENGRTIQVRLNDRGPFHPGRIIDLSRGAAKELGFFEKGTAQVRVRFISAAPFLNTTAGPGGVPQNPIQAAMNSTSATGSSQGLGSLREQTDAFGSPFMIQAGAFSDRANAERVAQKLSKTGRTEIRTFDHNGVRLYRVMVGSWSNTEEAGNARNRVASLGFSQARVVAGG